MQTTLLNLAFLCLLMMIFTSLYRARQESRLRYWMVAWMLVLVDFGVEQWMPLSARANLVQDNLHFDLLLGAGVSLLLSSIAAPMGLKDRVKLGLTLKLPGMVTVFLATVYPGAVWGLCGAVLAGQALAMWEARGLSGTKSRLRYVVQAMCVAVGVLMVSTVMVDASLVPYEVLMQVFVVDAVLAWRIAGRRERTRGAVAFSGGLLAWGVMYPAAILLAWEAPRLTVSPMVWNLPKLLTAFGMILMVLEEDTVVARRMTEEYRILFNQHPLPMWVFHCRTLRFLKVNDAAELQYGYTCEEFEAMTVEELRPPGPLPRLEGEGPREREGLEQTRSRRHVLKSGGVIDVDLYSHSICFEGQPARIVVALDVTERLAAEEQLRQAYKVESLGQMTGGVAHDFNNLLAVIQGNLELMAAQTADAASQEMVRQALGSVRKGTQLTRRLLRYARQEPREAELVRVGALVEEAAGFIERSLGPKIGLEVRVEAGGWPAAVDRSEMENALLNLALNARDAMRAGGRIEVGVANVRVAKAEAGPGPGSGTTGEIGPGDYVVVSVKDTGAGMTPAVLARAAEPFFTTKPGGEGTGLGLSMVHGFLKHAGGRMRMESAVGAGTTVRLYLPRSWAAMEIPVGAVAAEGGGRLPGGTERILVVEDEAVIRSLLVSLLSGLGYKVLEAEDGHRAMVHLHATPGIDLLLTDAVLPRGLSGTLLATGAKIVQPGIKVLFSSGYPRESLAKEHCFDPEMPLLVKPYHLAELARCVRGVLDGVEGSRFRVRGSGDLVESGFRA